MADFAPAHPQEFGNATDTNVKWKDMQDLNASRKGDLATSDYTCHRTAHYSFHPYSPDRDWTSGLSR